MFERGLIVSCQPRKGGYFAEDAWKFAADVEAHSVALRIEGLFSIAMVSQFADVPVIGLIKSMIIGNQVITGSYSEAKSIIEAGADYVAADATGRNTDIKEMARDFPVIGDISTFEEAKNAEKLGCVAVTTALSGYTDATKEPRKFAPPDFDLVEKCSKLSIPVIAEGRYHTIKMVQKAFAVGAHSVCIGGMITLPSLIAEHFNIPIKRFLHSKGKKFYLHED